MAIEGTIALSYFTPPNTKAPEPSPALIDGYGQTFCCPQTGRIWITGAATGQNTPQIRQVLPWVRNTAGTVETVMQNNSGNMKVTGTGDFNVHDMLRVDPNNGMYYTTGILSGNNDGLIEGRVAATWAMMGPINLTLSTTTPVGLSMGDSFDPFNFPNGYCVNYPQFSGHWVHGSLRFDHPNQYKVTVAIEQFNIITGASRVLHLSSQDSRGGPMQIGFETVVNTGADNATYGTSCRVRAIADVAGVVWYGKTAAGAWPESPATGVPQVSSTISHLRFL